MEVTVQHLHLVLYLTIAVRNNKSGPLVEKFKISNDACSGCSRNPTTCARLVRGNDMEVNVNFWVANGLRASVFDYSEEFELVGRLASGSNLRAAFPSSVATRRSAEWLLLSCD